MDIIATLVVIAAIGWLLVRHNTKSGKRAVGAHVYLSALDAGKNKADALADAQAAMEAPGKTVIHRTYERLQRDHQGKARKLVKAAEAKGFTL